MFVIWYCIEPEGTMYKAEFQEITFARLAWDAMKDSNKYYVQSTRP